MPNLKGYAIGLLEVVGVVDDSTLNCFILVLRHAILIILDYHLHLLLDFLNIQAVRAAQQRGHQGALSGACLPQHNHQVLLVRTSIYFDKTPL